MPERVYKSYKKLVIDFTIIGFFVFLTLSNFSQSWQLHSLNIFRKPHNPYPDIVLVAIDDKSLQAIGRWPWDRKVHAELLDKLNQSNPRLVSFDINFSEAQDISNDTGFSNAISRSKFPIVLAAEVVSGGDSQKILKPIDILLQAKNASTGIVNVKPDADGLARSYPIPIAGILPLSYQMAVLSGAEIPEDYNYLVDFAGPAGSMPTYSFSDILSGQVTGEKLQDKILIVGATAPDLHDYLSVPLAGNIMAGPEWHANVLDNILRQGEVKTLPKVYSIILTLVVGFLLWYLLQFLKVRSGIILSLASMLALLVSSWFLWNSRIALPYLLNIFLVGSLTLSQSFYQWYVSEAEKRKLRKTMEHYFSPQVMQHIVAHPEELRLGGDRREVTVLFSDIRSFTTITENTDPEILSQLLHEYFTEMTEEVLATDGVLDKFIGDAVMAFWGAPIKQDDQADRAIKAALGMLQRLDKLREKWAAKNWPDVRIGIGIHTGMATVGNMGSAKRFDYTVIGDAVNAASRLEGLTKEYKTPLIISEEVKNRLKGDYSFTRLGEVTVKGKTVALSIYSLTDIAL